MNCNENENMHSFEKITCIVFVMNTRHIYCVSWIPDINIMFHGYHGDTNIARHKNWASWIPSTIIILLPDSRQKKCVLWKPHLYPGYGT